MVNTKKINLSRGHMKSQRLKQHVQGLQRAAPHTLHMHYGFQFIVLMGLLSVSTSVSLRLLLSVGLFSFHWFVLPNFNVMISFVFFLTIFYYFLLKTVFLLMSDRKGVDLERRKEGEGLEGVEGEDSIIQIHCVKTGSLFNKR